MSLCMKRMVCKDGKEYTFFYTSQSPFSNYWICEKLEINGISFACTEQYFMYRKAMTFKDESTAADILAATYPSEMRRLGRQVKNFDVKVWDKEGINAMIEGNVHKYLQNEELRKELMETVGSTLVEASPIDRIWGIGLDLKNPNLYDTRKWRGKNLLGRILTEVRDSILEMELTGTAEDVIGDVKVKLTSK